LRDGQITDLGTLKGAARGEASGVSESGAVAGSCDFTNVNVTHACLWHDRTITDLGRLRPNANDLSGVAVNDRLQVVGYSGLDSAKNGATHSSGRTAT
jgi:probable HAF family extracellular repeat protein